MTSTSLLFPERTLKFSLLFCIILSALVSMPAFGQASNGNGQSDAAGPSGDDSSSRQFTPASLPSFGTVVTTDMTIDTLVQHVRSGRVDQIPRNKYIMIEGIVSSRQLLQPGEENFFGILELSSGEWKEENLRMFRCYFQLKGPRFAGLIPEGRKTSEENIDLHAHILAVGKYLGYGEDADGNRFPVLEAVQIRELKM